MSEDNVGEVRRPEDFFGWALLAVLVFGIVGAVVPGGVGVFLWVVGGVLAAVLLVIGVVAKGVQVGGSAAD